jgi:hypothetical protein
MASPQARDRRTGHLLHVECPLERCAFTVPLSDTALALVAVSFGIFICTREDFMDLM